MKVWEILQSIKTNGPAECYYGICSNFENLCESTPDVWEDNYESAFKSWDEFSGSKYYPVPGFDGQSANQSFDEASDDIMWDRGHEYGAARWRLLDHCIEWFKTLEHPPVM